jgi:CheY-like chemotaxis protein
MRTIAAPPFLVAEDDPDDMFLFTRLLKSTGAVNPLHLALNGQEAIDLLTRVVNGSGLAECPAAAFLDCGMPRVDGFEVLAWIRKRSAFDRLPVIMFCQRDDAHDIARAARLGAQCYLAKFPSKTVFERTLDEAARFAAGRGNRVFEIPNNLLLSEDAGSR